MSDADRFTVLERIARLAHVRLQRIRPPRFHCQASDVVRAAEHFVATNIGELDGGFRLQDKLILLSMNEQSEFERIEDGNPPAVVYNHVFQATGFIMPEPSDPASTDELIFRFAGDVHKAIATAESDNEDWAQFGGLALEALILPPQKHNSTDWWGFDIPFQVTYRHAENDPFTLR